MNHELKFVKISELIENYKDNKEEGVYGFGGKLNIRPAYQREFVYDDKQRKAVINSILLNRPLGVMYWSKNEDGSYEVLDGQQRTLSICQYCNNDFSMEMTKGLPRLFNGEKELLDYELLVYVFEGTNDEKIEWFKTINIAGEALTNQELLNAVYTGTWLNNAKERFSKSNCVASSIGSDLVKGSPIRQEYLETVLKWISNNDIANYMCKHQHDKNANELWLYFSNVIEWVKTTFGEGNFRKEMKGLEWGLFYNKYKDNDYDCDDLEEQVKLLMMNEEVTDKKGIYEYLLSNKDVSIAKKLSKRTFTTNQMRSKFEEQDGICPLCDGKFEIEGMAGDHILPWTKGGTTTIDNLQMICKHCNSTKSNKW